MRFERVLGTLLSRKGGLCALRIIFTTEFVSFYIFSLIRYTRVNSEAYGGPGAKTSVHAVLDYDDDFEDYYDDEEQDLPSNMHVTPIQGPIFLKNGSVPVVPLYTYPQLNNGTFVQIPVRLIRLNVLYIALEITLFAWRKKIFKSRNLKAFTALAGADSAFLYTASTYCVRFPTVETAPTAMRVRCILKFRPVK